VSKDADENARLKRVLAKLGTAPSQVAPQGREIGVGGSPDELLAAVLTEIDETQLPRRLRFETDLGAVLNADAYGRRLLALQPPGPAGLSAEHAGLIGVPLGDAEPERLASLQALLTAVLGPANRVWVRTETLAEARDPAVLGVAAETLAGLWSLRLGGPAPPKPTLALDRIVASAGPKSLAWLRLAGDSALASGGASDAIERLTAFAGDGLDTFRASEPNATGGAPRCVVLGRQDVSGALLAVAEAGGETVLILIRAGAMGEVTAAWRSVFRSSHLPLNWCASPTAPLSPPWRAKAMLADCRR
jgi:hypothetical protein